MNRPNFILPLLMLTITSCTTTMDQGIYDEEIVKAPVIVHQAKRYIESVGLGVSLLDVCKSGPMPVITKSHKIERNRQLDNVSIDWKSYEIRQDHGKDVLFVPLTHFRRTAVSKYTKDGRTKDNNYNTYSTLIIRYDSNNRMSILVGTYLYGRDMKEKEVMCMGIDFKSSGFSGYFITSYLDGTMLYGQYFEEGEKIFGFRPNPILPELRDSLPSENAHDHRHHLYLNLQFAKFTKSSNGTAIESFDYICSLCHKSWDQCTCIEIIDNPICNKCHSDIIDGHCQCDYCHYCGYLLEECVCNQPNGSLNNGGNTTNNGGINGNNNNGTSGTGSTSIGGGNSSATAKDRAVGNVVAIFEASEYNRPFNSETCGYCLRGWKTIWQEAGIGEYASCQYAKDFGPFLIKYGFREIPITWDYSEIPTPQQYTPQIGDTRVWQPYQGQNPPAGHIDWWNGTNWCSDYKQFNKWWPGNPYERNHPHYIIYR